MKNLPMNHPSFVNRVFGFVAGTGVADKTPSNKDIKYTLRVEDGVIHINNVSSKPEGVMYTLMAESEDGTTKLMNRYVALAPFQAFADDVEGAKVLAAWEKN